MCMCTLQSFRVKLHCFAENSTSREKLINFIILWFGEISWRIIKKKNVTIVIEQIFRGVIARDLDGPGLYTYKSKFQLSENQMANIVFTKEFFQQYGAYLKKERLWWCVRECARCPWASGNTLSNWILTSKTPSRFDSRIHPPHFRPLFHA